MASMERKSTPEVELDVDAIIQQLKQTKDKELRLRSEKERVRKELEALRTGDLWSRETATQRQLEAIQARKRELEGRESTEAGHLKQLDDALREREVTVQKQRRPPSELSAMSQAGSAIIGSASVARKDGSPPRQPVATSGVASKTPSEAPLPMNQPPSPQRDQLISDQVRGSRRRSGNQEADAVDKLEFSIDLKKQQKRIQRLQAQLEKSESMRKSSVSGWDRQSVATASNETLRRRAHSPNATFSPRESGRLGSNQEVLNSSHYERDTQTVHKAVRDQLGSPVKKPNQPPPPVGPQIDLVHPAASFQQQLTAYPAMPGFASQPQPFPQYSPSPWLSMMPQMPWPGSVMQPYPMLSQAMPAYTMVSPPMLPMFSPPAYAPPFANPYFPQASFGYPPTQNHQPMPSHQDSPAEREVSQLQQQLDWIRKQEQQTEDDKEFAKVQELLSGLKNQVTQLARSRSSEAIEMITEEGQAREVAEPDLKSLKRQHLEAMLKVRNERDLLEEQDKLEETRERVEKRREERQREHRHDEWVTKQKRELTTLQLQRALAKLDTKNNLASKNFAPEMMDSSQPYTADGGVLLCWDFVSGLPIATPKAQLTFAVYDGKIPRSTIKSIGSKTCEAEGPSHARAIFASQRVVKPIPASLDDIVAVEISSITQKTEEEKPVVRRLGWTVVELFRLSEGSSEPQLVSGWLKARLRTTPMPDPSRVWLPDVAARQETDGGSDQSDIVLHFRVGNGEIEAPAREFVVDPETHAGLYYLPHQQQHRVQPHQSQASESQASVTTPTAASVKPTTNLPSTTQAENTRVTSSSSGSADPKPAVFRRASGTDQDFLDLERLRLLSSSSATTRPPSSVVRPRSTLSTAPRNRLGALKEDVFFDDSAPKSPWIRTDRSTDRRRYRASRLFQSDDAFDVYVDGARYLPDNVTVTKVTLAALNADRSKISPPGSQPTSQLAVLKSEACCPAYNLYVEYREKGFNPTLSLVMRVDTLDIRTKLPVIMGYAIFPVFLDSESQQQSTRPNEAQFVLNEGAFQLPLYTNATLSDAQNELSAASAVASFPKIPCATLLIRVRQAATSEDGLNVMSRADFPPHEWAAKGLEEPTPSYESGEYDSSACIPSAMEVKMYHLRGSDKSKRSLTVQQKLQQLGVGEAAVPGLLQAKPIAFVDLRSAFHYRPALGFRVSIDGLHNIKAKAGAFCKVLFSVAPPAAFYQAIRLTSDLHFTTTTDWTSLPTSPEFKDGFAPFRAVPADSELIVVIDIRAVTKNAKTGVWTSQPLAWSFLPVLDHKTESVAAGNIQLPLFVGDVKLASIASASGIASVVEEVAAEKRKLQLSFMEGASVFVRLEDPQAPSTPASQPLTDAVASSMIPPKAIPRYQYEAAKMALLKKKSPLSRLVPPGTTDKQLEKEINEAFAAELGIPHSSY